MINQKNEYESPKVIVKTSVRYKSGLIDQLEIEMIIEEPSGYGVVRKSSETVLRKNLAECLRNISIALEGIDLKIGMSKMPIEKFLNEKIQKL